MNCRYLWICKWIWNIIEETIETNKDSKVEECFNR